MSDDNKVLIDEGSGEKPTSDVADPSAAAEVGVTSSSGDVAKALNSIVSTVIKDFDFRADNTARTQDHLSLSIDRLTRELDQLLEDAPVPFLMQHASRISGVRKRVSSLNLLLRSIQRRLDNVDRVLSVGLQHEKVVSEGSAKPQ